MFIEGDGFVDRKIVITSIQVVILLIILFSVLSPLWIITDTVVGELGVLLNINSNIEKFGMNILLSLGIIWLELIKGKY